MSLFLRWVVGSLVSTLYVLVSCSNAWALLVYSSWSMMTMATPHVCCKNHPGVVLLELCEGSALGRVEVAVVVVLLFLFEYSVDL